MASHGRKNNKLDDKPLDIFGGTSYGSSPKENDQRFENRAVPAPQHNYEASHSHVNGRNKATFMSTGNAADALGFGKDHYKEEEERNIRHYSSSRRRAGKKTPLKSNSTASTEEERMSVWRDAHSQAAATKLRATTSSHSNIFG